MDAADHPVAVADCVGGRGAHFCGYLQRVIEMLLRNTANGGRYGGRKQGYLPFGRCMLHDPLNVVDKAHAQHFVGFIKDKTGQALQVQGFAADVVHHAARRADNNMHAAFERPELQLIALTAIHGQNVKSFHVGCIGLKGFGNLNCQLTRGGQHQHLRLHSG